MGKVIKGALQAATVVFLTVTGLNFLAAGTVTGIFTSGALAGLSAASQLAIFTFASTAIAAGIGMLTTKGVNATVGNFGTKFASRTPNAPRQIVYGQCRVGGTILHMETQGTDNHMLHMIVALAGHEIEDILTVRLNDTDLTSTTSTISSTTVHTVTNSEFTNTDNANSFTSGRLIRFTKNLGADDQSADAFAISSLSGTSASITSNHRYRGIAYLYIQLIYDSEAFGGGLPAISCVVKGKKVFDPRNSSTAFSTNPALIIRDFLTDTRYGLKATSDEINDATTTGGFASAANICDQTVTLADGSTTETRYTCSGFTNMSASGEGVLEGLLSSCGGRISYTNGKFNLFAGASQTASLTITDDDILEPINVSTNVQTGELYNTVKAMYVNADEDFVGTDAPILQSSTFLNEDTPSGESSANYVKTLEIQLPFTTSSTMAQRLASIILKANRKSTTLSVLASTKFLQLQPNDFVQLTNERLSFSNKLFLVTQTNLELTGGDDTPVVAVRLGLKEIASDVYDFAGSEYTSDVSEGGAVTTRNLALTAPASLSASAVTNNSFTVNSVNALLTWTNSHDENFIIGTQIQYKVSTDSNFDDYAMVSANISRAVVRGLEANKTYNIRVRHVGVLNQFSAFSTVNLSTGGTVRGSADVITSEGTAANINNQGNLATLDNVNTAQLVDDAVTTAKIIDDAVTNALIATDAVNQDSIAANSVTATEINVATLSSISANVGTLTAGTIEGGSMTINDINATNITAGTLNVGRIAANSIDVPTKVISGSVGEIGGTSGQNSSDNSQTIEITELVRFIYGDNSKPKHIVGTASTTHNPNVSVGDVMGGSPRFNFNFTTHGYSGNKDYVVSVGLDFTGSTTSSSESIFAVAMRATTSSTNFTSQTESDYIFTDKIASAGSHAAGPHILNAKVSLAGNTEHYIWCFALGDDGINAYKSGFINVFGLND